MPNVGEWMTQKSISISDIVNPSKVKLKVIPYLIFIDLPFPICVVSTSY